jgi:hypothetical protein
MRGISDENLRDVAHVVDNLRKTIMLSLAKLPLSIRAKFHLYRTSGSPEGIRENEDSHSEGHDLLEVYAAFYPVAPHRPMNRTTCK